MKTNIHLWFLVSAVVGVGDACAGQEEPSSSRDGARSVAPGVVELSPGVRANFKEARVELDAVVVLREGPLELLACSDGTREHESILVTQGRPLHMFQAMGLIGLEPGHPVQYDPATQRWSPPAGEPLDIRISCSLDGKEQSIEAREWLLDVNAKRAPTELNWIFAGSQSLDNGRFAADSDGTVICLVDFDTALISVAGLHTAENELLWLAANTERIPPRGTRCTILIRSALTRIQALVAADGSVSVEGKNVTIEHLVQQYEREKGQDADFRIELVGAADTPGAVLAGLLKQLADQGVPRSSVRVIQPPEAASATDEASEADKPDSKVNDQERTR